MIKEEVDKDKLTEEKTEAVEEIGEDSKCVKVKETIEVSLLF